MDITSDTADGIVCTCNRHAPDKWRLTSVAFLARLANDTAEPGLPIPQIVYRAFEELHNSSDGFLFDLNDQPIDFNREYKDGLDVFEWAFGKDWARGMRRFLERAERPFRNQMKQEEKLLMRILLLHYAREIRRCRTTGSCSKSSSAHD